MLDQLEGDDLNTTKLKSLGSLVRDSADQLVAVSDGDEILEECEVNDGSNTIKLILHVSLLHDSTGQSDMENVGDGQAGTDVGDGQSGLGKADDGIAVGEQTR